MLQKRRLLGLGSLWFDELSPQVEAFLVDAGGADEFVLGALRTGPVDGYGGLGAGWLVVTVSRAYLVWHADEGAAHVEELSGEAGWRCDESMARDTFWAGARRLFRGPVVGAKRLRALGELVPMSGRERLCRAAELHHLAGAERWDEPDSVEAAVVFDAHLDAGDASARVGAFEEAAAHFLGAIRWQMHRPEGYARLFEVAPRLSPARRRQVALARQVLAWVDPAARDALAAPLAAAVVSGTRGARFDDVAHDELLVHPGERSRKAAVHRLLARWACGREDAETLRVHCPRADRKTLAELCALVDEVAAMLGIPAPPVHLSGQPAGVSALGHAGRPFVLLAEDHVRDDSARRLTGGQLAFALGMAIEHIRAGHLLLTHEHYVSSLKRRGVQLALVAGEWLGARGLLGAASTRAFGLARPVVGARDVRASVDQSGEWLALSVDAARAQPTALARWAKKRAHRGHRHEAGTDAVFERRGLAEFARLAQYTADRAGLCACGDVDDAITAVFRLRPDAAGALERLRRRGLAGLEDGEVCEELLSRVVELCRFALSEEYARLGAFGCRASTWR